MKAVNVHKQLTNLPADVANKVYNSKPVSQQQSLATTFGTEDPTIKPEKGWLGTAWHYTGGAVWNAGSKLMAGLQNVSDFTTRLYRTAAIGTTQGMGLADVKAFPYILGQLHGQGASVVGLVHELADRLIPCVFLAVGDEQPVVPVDDDVRIRDGFRGDDSLAHPSCFHDFQFAFKAVELGITQGGDGCVDEVVPPDIGVNVCRLDAAVILVQPLAG